MRVRGWFTLAALVLRGGVLEASVITITLGDKDGLGYGLSPGQTFPLPFDKRTPTDPAWTDLGAAGETNAWFTFSYSPIGATADSVWMEFGFGGLEDARNDSGRPDFNDRLFLDNVEIPGAFDTDHTGMRKYGIVTLSIPVGMLTLLADGTAAFFFDGWPYGTSPTPRAGDQVFFDYVTLNINYTELLSVPAPSGAVLAGLGAGLALSLRRLSSRRSQ